MSFWACVAINSLPLVSSMEYSLYPPPPLVLLDLIPLMFCEPGRAHGGICSALYTRPVMMGRSGSPSRKSTMTSWPMRGFQTPPHCLPAHGCDARIQHELFSLFLPSRSQWN